ncbi:two-component system, unclassified family, sensor kinase [Pustulibacterium marinum]|uniref:histidine kinase n=1 Tax=Pustulibacterium marinum TaxID=1224947 RepID=A0A1I7GWX1_9FLAO|nr:ATP-binding protein [Pustulibacterium marinum]SFU52948.1 two-component system, unclassified family, sensor kinase [Pustulibacterium marinum]
MLYEKDLAFQKTLNDTIIETQEQTLNNIAQDLHDDAGQQLTFLNFQLENLKLDHPEFCETLTPVSDSLRHLSQSIRSVSHSLSNQLLLQHSLVKAIAQEVERLQKNNTIEIYFTLHGSLQKKYDTNETILVYRIFQEIMNNIFKHSEARKVDIILDTNPVFKLHINDNGKGFDYLRTQQNNTLGLKNIVHRAAVINYEVAIDSKPGKGTTIILTQKTTT